MNREKLKKIYKKLFVPKVALPSGVKKIHEKVGLSLVGERTFFLGKFRKKVDSLLMESAPGTSETVIELLGQIKPQGKVLDFGCGQHQSQYLKNLGLDIHSCDVFDFSLPNYTKIDSKKLILPFADNAFEAVVVSEVIEHVESPFALLNEIFRIAQKYVIVTTPNPMSTKSRACFSKTGYLYWFAPENFAYHISPVFLWQIEKFCQRHGHVLKETRGNHEVFELGKGQARLNLAEAIIVLIEK